MVTTSCICCICALGLITLLHLGLGLRFLFRLSWPSQPDASQISDRTMLILCLRGDDPFLEKTLVDASNLEHSNYFIRVIVDSDCDPAKSIVEEVIKETGSDLFEVQTLERRRRACSLKCSALIQALQDVPTDTKYIALLDADTQPHSKWLSQLLRPMANSESIAVTTGNRWYRPAKLSLGSMTRYVWNTGAAAQMVFFQVPWGGSLAMRRSFVDQVNLPQKLRSAFCEDTMLKSIADAAKQRVEFVPDVLMFNGEDCTVRELMPWISRQSLCLKLYHPAWRKVLSIAVLQLLVWLAICLTLISSVLVSNWANVGILTRAMGLSVLAIYVGVLLLECAVALRVRSGEHLGKPFLAPRPLYGILAVVYLQLAYPFSILRCVWTKSVAWRGIQYGIGSDKSITMATYRPFRFSAPQRNIIPLPKSKSVRLQFHDGNGVYRESNRSVA